MQVAPIKPTLKAPGTERLQLKYEELLSNFGFKFNLRRYSKMAKETEVESLYFLGEMQAGAYTRPLFSSTQALSV